ncbi:MAG: glycosyltransferase, partial [Chloroflexi bacterium]
MSRVLILANEHVRQRMAGPAIRCFEFARELSTLGHAVTLASPFPSDLPPQAFPVETYDASGLERLAARFDVVVMQGFVLDQCPGLRDAAQRLVVDLYDPFPLEELLISARAPMQARLEVQDKALRAVNDAIRDADFVLCASEKQRDYWLGALSALNRVNPHTYTDDATLRALIDVVPFGVPSEPPQRRRHAIRDGIPGIDGDDVVVLWGGGIYAWFDPLTVIRAVALAAPECPALRLVFMSTGHPNPEIQEMWTNAEAQRLAAELGLTGRHVFFNPDWVPYHERADWLLDADVGVTAHFDHIETRFSFRTRVLDYLWAGLPVICTAGDTLADAVERRELGITVPAEDPAAVARALLALAADPAMRATRGTAAREYASSLTWPAAIAPLARYCADPRPAPDRVAVAPLRRVPLPSSRVPDGAAQPPDGARPAPARPVGDQPGEDAGALREQLDRIERSYSFRAAHRASRTARRVLPPGSPQRRAVGTMARRLGVLPSPLPTLPTPVNGGPSADPRTEWTGRDLPWSRPASQGDLDWQRHLSTTVDDPVRVTVVVLSGSGYWPLQTTLGSLQAQSWPYWDAVILEPEVIDNAPEDPRIRRFHSPSPLAMANERLQSCRSRDLVVLLRGGDTLEPDCLFEVAVAALRDPTVDLVHWDDRVSPDGAPGGRARVR